MKEFQTIREAIQATGDEFVFHVTGCGSATNYDIGAYDDENRGIVSDQLRGLAPETVFVFRVGDNKVISAVPRPKKELLGHAVEALKRSNHDFIARTEMTKWLMFLIIRKSCSFNPEEHAGLISGIAAAAVSNRITTVEQLETIVHAKTAEFFADAESRFERAQTIRNLIFDEE